MIEVLLKGLVVGVLVAAPVGPIGILCIKRVLSGGWIIGVATGLGVASADATYGLMVAAGFAATGLLVSFAGPMQIAGGLLIAILGALSLRAFLRPERGNSRAAPNARGLWGAFASAFGLTLSNPMTILAFAGLVAGLGAAAAGQAGATYVLVAGVFLGSLLWWVFLSTATALARRRLSPGLARWLDLVSGLVLLAWGLRIAWQALTA